MRRLVVAILLLGSSTALAQNAPAGLPQPTQQVASRKDAADRTATSATSAATISLVPNTGQTVTIYEIDIVNCAGASAVTAAAPTTITTTNITGALAFTVGSGVTAGVCTERVITYPTGLLGSAPGVVTLVLPTFASNQTIRVNVAYKSTITPNP